MRHKRAKAYKKLVALYHISFGFREPYQVLVDSEMCTISTSLKMDLVRQFAIILQGSVKPMITQCSIVELYKLGTSEQKAVDLAKTFERRKCNHREAISGIECIASVVGDFNKHRYVIACQSLVIRTRLRGVPGVPLVHLNRTVMVLEPPSDATIQAKRRAEEKALLPSNPEQNQITADGSVDAPKRRKGPKAPNPLSVKKKKVRTNDSSQAAGQAKVGGKRKLEEEHTARPVGDMQDPNDDKPKRKRRKRIAVANAEAPD